MCTGSTVYLLIYHWNDTCVVLFDNSGKAEDYTKEKLELESSAICILVITYFTMVLNMCIFLIAGSRVVAGKCSSRVVMPLPWSWKVKEGHRSSSFIPINIDILFPFLREALLLKAGTRQVVPFWFYECSVWKSGSSCLGTQGSKSILGALREQRKCFSLPPSCCQQPGLGSDFGVSLGSLGSLCHLSPAVSCRAGLAGHLRLLMMALTDNPVGQPAGTWDVHPSFSFLLHMQRSLFLTISNLYSLFSLFSQLFYSK